MSYPDLAWINCVISGTARRRFSYIRDGNVFLMRRSYTFWKSCVFILSGGIICFSKFYKKFRTVLLIKGSPGLPSFKEKKEKVFVTRISLV